MTYNNEARSTDKPPQPISQPRPSRSARVKPFEFVVLSGVMGLFVGLVTLMATRDFAFASISFGVAFIIVLVVIAMFTLGGKPDKNDRYLGDENNREGPVL
jgi:hypothetical protein